MNSRKLKIAGYMTFITTSFIISTVFTILLMTSTVTSRLEYKLVVGMAIILQLSTTLFVAKAMLDKKIHMTVRVIMVCISVSLLFASIIANVGLIQNNANKTRNNERRASSEYQQAEQHNLRQQNLHDAKLEEIKNTTTSFDIAIEQTRDTIQKSTANWERNKHTDTLKTLTEQKTKRLAELNAELNNITISPINTDAIAIDSENGYYSTFVFLSQARIVKWIFKDVTADQLQNYFFILLSSIFEFINMIALYLFSVFMKVNIKKAPTPDQSPKQKIPTPTPKENSPKLNIVKSNRPLGSKASSDFRLRKTPQNIADSDIKKYLDYMYKTAENNISQGYIKISKNIGLSQEKCRKIKAWLEQEGIVKVEGGRTLIIKNNNSLVG